jgi:hypothetical protein
MVYDYPLTDSTVCLNFLYPGPDIARMSGNLLNPDVDGLQIVRSRNCFREVSYMCRSREVIVLV